MGYWSGVSANYLLPSTDGRLIYYPLGALWKGYVVQGDEQISRIRSFIKYKLLFFFFIFLFNGYLIEDKWMRVMALLAFGFTIELFGIFLARGMPPCPPIPHVGREGKCGQSAW